MKDLFDICANRHKNNAESVVAHQKIIKTKRQQRQRVLARIRDAGPEGLTCRELAREWDVGLNCISGRFSELKMNKEIIQCGRRDGCGVYKELQ